MFKILANNLKKDNSIMLEVNLNNYKINGLKSNNNHIDKKSLEDSLINNIGFEDYFEVTDKHIIEIIEKCKF